MHTTSTSRWADGSPEPADSLIQPVTVIGGGIAGTEAALQLASRNVPVRLIEMRPVRTSPAHHTDLLAELVCSNSLKSDDPSSATGALKRELALLGSHVLSAARETAVPAGAALAVDRDRFSALLTSQVEEQSLIELCRHEQTTLPQGRVVVATGPLTSPGFEPVLSELTGADRLAFWDAAAPIVDAETLDRSVLFAASRYEKGDGADYLNAPLDRSEYDALVAALVSAKRVNAKDFERRELFSACQPIEEIARTGPDALRYGALKPVGLVDPRTGERPWAVVQLRSENAARTAYNLVGFQTNLTFPEQRRILRMIPGLSNAEILRFGVMHRNTYVDAPRLLTNTLALRGRPDVRLAGQLTGTEGYLEAAATGLLAAVNTAAELTGAPAFVPPAESLLGALIAYATDEQTTSYQPMHVNYGIVPPLKDRIRSKRERYARYSSRAHNAMHAAVSSRPDLFTGIAVA